MYIEHVFRGLEDRIGKETVNNLFAGSCYWTEAFWKHRHEHPAIERAYYELRAVEIRDKHGLDYALDYMREHGYNGINWQ